MTIMRFISRLILQKPSSSPTPRWLCAVAEGPAAEAAAKQPSEKAHLFYKVVKKPNTDKSTVAEVLDNWVNQGNEVKRYDLLNISNYFRIRKNFHAALQLYNWMESSKFEMINADKAVRIDLLCKTEGVSSAENYFNTLQESEKTSKTLGALLCSYCKEKYIDKAIETFEKMKVLNYTSTLNYNNMLLLYYSTGKHEKVLSLVQEMEENNIPLDLYTYNLLIRSYIALKNLDEIEGVLAKMKSNNVEGDIFTYGNLGTIYTNSGLHEKANACLEMMEKMESRPDKNVLEACRTRIKFYSEMNNFPGVHRAWKTLKSAFKNPNNASYILMLVAFSKMGDQENLEKIYKEWEENCSSAFDLSVPNVVLEFYLSRDMMEEATSLYKILAEKGVEGKPNLRTMDLFATLNVKNGDIDSGLKYLEIGSDKANGKWFPSDDTIKIFRKYFKENHDPDRAERFFQVLKARKRVDSDFNTKAPDQEVSI